MSRREDDLRREIEQHLALDAEERAAEGLAPDEARRAARRAFGSVALAREDARAVWRPLWAQHLAQDMRYALRLARRTPGFTCGAVLVFALGIAASTTVFGALEAVVLAPMPYGRPHELVRLTQTHAARGVDAFSVSLPLYRDWKARSRSFRAMAASRAGAVTLEGLGEPRRVDVLWITHDWLDLHGVTPAIGRAFSAGEDQPGRGDVVMLSSGLWLSTFGGDPRAVGRSFRLDGRVHRIVGVAPPDPLRPGEHVLLPLVPFTESRRGFADLDVVARLADGVPAAVASAEMRAIAADLAREHPDSHEGWSVRVLPLAAAVLGTRTPQVLYLLCAAVGLLVLVACANLSALLLVRASVREREMAVRAAVGGGRGRLVRQLLTESVLLALAGGGLGVLLSLSGLRVLRAALSTSVPRAAEIGVSLPVLVFALTLSAVTGLLAGVAPARQMSRLDLGRRLRDGARSIAPGRARARQGLVIGQLALSLVLLAAAGLTIRTLDRLHAVDLGFAPADVVTARIEPRERPETFVAALLDRVRALPEVDRAGAVSSAPMTDANLSLHVFPVGPSRLGPSESIQADWRVVTDGYFAAMQTPIVAGRDFRRSDDARGPKVIIVNATLARLLWGDEDPLARRVDLGGGGGEPATVVGVVADMRHHNPALPPRPAYYVPAARGIFGGMTLAMRTRVDRAALLPRVRAEAASLDPALPIFDAQSMASLVASRLTPQRLVAAVLALFGAAALALSVLGLYAVMSFAVRLRRREAAVRLALGATRRVVVRGFVREGGILLVSGLVIGLGISLVVTRLMRSLLFDVSPADPLTMTVAVSLLAGTALLACYLPARRASRTNPLDALRDS